MTSDQLARQLGWQSERLARLLQAANALRLVCRDKQAHWWLDDLGVVVTSDAGIEAMIRHHDMLYADLLDPVSLFRDAPQDTRTHQFWAYAGDARDAVKDAPAAAYSQLMAQSQAMFADTVLDAVSIARDSVLLDVGGGEGAFAIRAGLRHRDLTIRLMDLPPVTKRAEAKLAEAGLGARSAVFPGSFFDTPLPAGNDCISLIRVLCDHDDQAALRLLVNIRPSVAGKTRLIIAEAMAGPQKGERLASAYFTGYFAAMRSGRCRTPDEIEALLKQAGFTRFERVRTALPLIAGVIIARV